MIKLKNALIRFGAFFFAALRAVHSFFNFSDVILIINKGKKSFFIAVSRKNTFTFRD